jgi:hypothetical protein
MGRDDNPFYRKHLLVDPKTVEDLIERDRSMVAYKTWEAANLKSQPGEAKLNDEPKKQLLDSEWEPNANNQQKVDRNTFGGGHVKERDWGKSEEPSEQ